MKIRFFTGTFFSIHALWQFNNTLLPVFSLFNFRRPLYVFIVFTVQTTFGKRRRYYYGNQFVCFDEKLGKQRRGPGTVVAFKTEFN